MNEFKQQGNLLRGKWVTLSVWFHSDVSSDLTKCLYTKTKAWLSFVWFSSLKPLSSAFVIRTARKEKCDGTVNLVDFWLDALETLIESGSFWPMTSGFSFLWWDYSCKLQVAWQKQKACGSKNCPRGCLSSSPTLLSPFCWYKMKWKVQWAGYVDVPSQNERMTGSHLCSWSSFCT